MLTLLDLPPDDLKTWSPVSTQRRQRILDAVKRLLFRQSSAQPLLVILEDLHSVDPETQVLIDGVVDSLPATRLVLLVTCRPEYRNDWGGKTYYTQVRIDSLPPSIAREMLNALIGTHSGGQVKNLLIERPGTPFFLEESVRAAGGDRGVKRHAGMLQCHKIDVGV